MGKMKAAQGGHGFGDAAGLVRRKNGDPRSFCGNGLQDGGSIHRASADVKFSVTAQCAVSNWACMRLESAMRTPTASEVAADIGLVKQVS